MFGDHAPSNAWPAGSGGIKSWKFLDEFNNKLNPCYVCFSNCVSPFNFQIINRFLEF